MSIWAIVLGILFGLAVGSYVTICFVGKSNEIGNTSIRLEDVTLKVDISEYKDRGF